MSFATCTRLFGMLFELRSYFIVGIGSEIYLVGQSYDGHVLSRFMRLTRQSESGALHYPKILLVLSFIASVRYSYHLHGNEPHAWELYFKITGVSFNFCDGFRREDQVTLSGRRESTVVLVADLTL